MSRWLTSLLIFLAVGAPASSLAFECKVSSRYDYVSLRWDERTVRYGLREGSGVQPTHIAAAFGTWSSLPCTDIEFEYVGEVSADRDDVNQVVFVGEQWLDVNAEKPRPADAVAVTLTHYALDSGIIRGATIEVNEEFFDFADVNQVPACTGVYDLIAVVTHEVGHFIGLDHTRSFQNEPSDPTMAPEVGDCEADKRTLEADDVDAACLIYPAGAPSRNCMPLPAQTDTFVENRAFGCRHLPGSGRGTAAIITFLGIALHALRSRPRTARDRCRTCPEARSG